MNRILNTACHGHTTIVLQRWRVISGQLGVHLSYWSKTEVILAPSRVGTEYHHGKTLEMVQNAFATRATRRSADLLVQQTLDRRYMAEDMRNEAYLGISRHIYFQPLPCKQSTYKGRANIVPTLPASLNPASHATMTLTRRV
jgi:hypothetical protein